MRSLQCRPANAERYKSTRYPADGPHEHMTGNRHDEAMRLALDEARAAAEQGDVPIGAVVLDPGGTVVAVDHNRREQRADPTAHAEILALRTAARQAGSWRLDGHTLVVTLEPCPMCAGAAVNARVATIVYGAADPKAGAALSLYNVPQDPRLNHRCDIVHGVRAGECERLLTDFFTARRGAGTDPSAT